MSSNTHILYAKKRNMDDEIEKSLYESYGLEV